VRPEHCGYGRPISSLPDGDREAVEGFRGFPAGRVAMIARTGEFVPLERAGEPGIITREDATR
jgi:hypothetical protein